MLETAGSLSWRTIARIGEVAPGRWDLCAGQASPFTRHAFLHALERSGSAVAERGWQARHLLVEDEAGTLLGAAPLYLKGHSFGEYVFDWAWADAYERAGGRYYPKLQCAVPFTPVTGPRLMVRADLAPAARPRVLQTLSDGMIGIARQNGLSSVHVTFPENGEWRHLSTAGYLQRLGLQFHLTNPGYRDFENFLAALTARKRKQIRRERRDVADSGIRIRQLTGSDIQPHHWDAFYAFYCATADKRWGVPYLESAFFHEIGETMADRILLVIAENAQGRPVAGALNLIGDDALYGRNWGCAADYKFLHFEACYYQAIDFAIAHGLSRVEAGAQGEHKLQRGYCPVPTYSAHWIADPGLAGPVADFLHRERQAVQQEITALSEKGPYHQSQ